MTNRAESLAARDQQFRWPVGDRVKDSHNCADADLARTTFHPEGPTLASDPLLLGVEPADVP